MLDPAFRSVRQSRRLKVPRTHRVRERGDVRERYQGGWWALPGKCFRRVVDGGSWWRMAEASERRRRLPRPAEKRDVAKGVVLAKR